MFKTTKYYLYCILIEIYAEVTRHLLQWVNNCARAAW